MRLSQSYIGLGLKNGSSLLQSNRRILLKTPQVSTYVFKGKRFKTDSVQSTNANDKLHRIIKRSSFLTKLNSNPKYKHYFDKLSEAGAVSTVTSFLILHEITAIIPLFALWGILYNLDISDQYEMPVYFKDLFNKCGESISKLVGEYDNGWDRDRLVVSGAISYAIVKFLYPVRVLFSLWAAPYMWMLVVAPFKKLRALFR